MTPQPAPIDCFVRATNSQRSQPSEIPDDSPSPIPAPRNERGRRWSAACADRCGVAACAHGDRDSGGRRWGGWWCFLRQQRDRLDDLLDDHDLHHVAAHFPHSSRAATKLSFVTAVSIAGNGSSFASPAVTNWADQVGQSPYNITVSYTPSSSGQGRYEFTNGTVDYAVSDTGYVDSSVGTTPPSFPYEFIPITAAGVAFMYNIPGLTQTLQLTSYTACLLLTGQIKNWDDPALKQNGANANVTLPNLPVLPITESDPAGTNFVLEEYCIDEQPAVWAAYAKNMGAGCAAKWCADLGDEPWFELGGARERLRRTVDLGSGFERGQQCGCHRSRPGELRQRLGVHRVQPGQGSGRGRERERQIHLANPGGRRLGPGLCHATGERDTPAQFQRIGSERLQPVDLQLPPHPDQGMVHRQRGTR